MTFHTLDMDYFRKIAERVNRERAQERAEALIKKNEPKPEVQEEEKEEEKTQRIITPSEITNPQNYLILEGRTHEKYSYPDMLVAKERSHFDKEQLHISGRE